MLKNVNRKRKKRKKKDNVKLNYKKKQIAEKKFKEWLENTKNKPPPAIKSFGYASEKHSVFYSGNSYPEPALFNPIPGNQRICLLPKTLRI